jgi:hypothetical protein
MCQQKLSKAARGGKVLSSRENIKWSNICVFGNSEGMERQSWEE